MKCIQARDERLKLSRDKVLPGSFSADADRLRQFEQEGAGGGRLNHPSITRSTTSERTTGLLCRAGLLEAKRGAVIAEERSRQEGDRLLGQSRGLAAAPKNRSPGSETENIFVMRDGRVKILDFGWQIDTARVFRALA
jgi:hypothetical protein